MGKEKLERETGKLEKYRGKWKWEERKSVNRKGKGRKRWKGEKGKEQMETGT